MRQLRVLQEILKFRISDLRDYINDSNKYLKGKQTELDQDLKDKLAEIDDEEDQQQTIDWFLDDNLKYFSDFPEIQHDALFLVIYSFFELSLSRICTMVICDASVRKITLTPPKDNYVATSKNWLISTAKVKIKAKENIWSKLNRLREYRNFIAHNGSNLQHTRNAADKIKKKETISYINRYFKKPIAENQHGECHIEKVDLLLDFLSLVEVYLNFVITQGLKKHKK